MNKENLYKVVGKCENCNGIPWDETTICPECNNAGFHCSDCPNFDEPCEECHGTGENREINIEQFDAVKAREILFKLISALSLCDHMGDVNNYLCKVFEILDLEVEWEDSLSPGLTKLGINKSLYD